MDATCISLPNRPVKAHAYILTQFYSVPKGILMSKKWKQKEKSQDLAIFSLVS